MVIPEECYLAKDDECRQIGSIMKGSFLRNCGIVLESLVR